MENLGHSRGSGDHALRDRNYSLTNGQYSWANVSKNRTGDNSENLYSDFQFRGSIAMSICYGIVQLIGVPGNVLVVISILHQRRLHNNHYLLVMNLATCDLLLHVWAAFYITLSPWILNDKLVSTTFSCKFWTTSDEFFYVLEPYLLVFIAALRYRAVLHPQKPPLTRRRVRWLLFLFYLLSFVWMIPYVITLDTQDGTCLERWTDNLAYQIYDGALAVYESLLPIALVTFLYVKTCHRLLIQNRTIHEHLSAAPGNNNRNQNTTTIFHNARQARNARVVLTSIIVTVCFAVPSVVVQITWFLHSYFSKLNYDEFLWAYLTYFILVGSVNPIIYGFGDKTLRLGYKKSIKKILSSFALKRRSVRVVHAVT